MALVGTEGGSKKPAPKTVAKPKPLPKNPTPADMAALDLQYSNVAGSGLLEDEQAAYDPFTGTVKATPIDDLPKPGTTYPSVPKVPSVLKAQVQAIVSKAAGLKAGPGLTAASAGYGVSENIEDRRGVAPVPPRAPKMLGELNRLVAGKGQ